MMGAGRRFVGGALDLLVVLLLIAILALPVGAVFAVAGVPIGPAAPVVDAPVVDAPPGTPAGSTKPLRDVPVFSPDGAAQRAVDGDEIWDDPAALRAAIDRIGRSIFAGGSTDAFWAALDADGGQAVTDGQGGIGYPYVYPVLDPLLAQLLPAPVSPATAVAATDLAGLLTIAGVLGGDNCFCYEFPGRLYAGGAAYAILKHVRESVSTCDTQLNLAALVTVEMQPLDDVIVRELELAAQLCAGDPTPLWLLGQFQLGRSYVVRPPGEWMGQVLPRDQLNPRPLATFRTLQREYPVSPAGWAGEADLELHLARDADANGVAPFEARQRYLHALALYQRAADLSGEPGIRLNQAASLTGLDRYDEANAILRGELSAHPGQGVIQTRLVDNLERGHRFAEAADALRAGRAGSGAILPSGRTLASWPSGASIGAERASPVQLNVGPPPGGADFVVYDFGFVPDYRESRLFTTVDSWCRLRSELRDQLVAGRAAQVIEYAGESPPLLRVNDRSDCDEYGWFTRHDPDPIAADNAADELAWYLAVAAAELGRDQAAHTFIGATGLYEPDARVDGTPKWVTRLFDERQNLWRWAGNLERAAEVTRDWRSAVPDDPLAWERSGEVAFLRRQYADAATWFTETDRRSRLSTVERTAEVELERAAVLLRQGAAETLAGQASGLSTLDSARDLGLELYQRFYAENGQDDTSNGTADGAYRGLLVAYHADDQHGDALLRAGDAAGAAERYAGAAEAVAKLDVSRILTYEQPREQQPDRFHNGVVENNLALAQIRLGDGPAAIGTAETALSRDQDSPIFRQTLAYAYQTAGQASTAIDIYRDALAIDPTLFPVENDLAVLLAESGRDTEAIVELRRAVGAEPNYALGWFNLGVLLSRQGPDQFLAAQGALGRAGRLDSTLRGRQRELVYDREPYYTGLDLSRPLPPQWRFANSEQRSPALVTLVAIALLLGRLVWNLGLDQVAGKLGERVVAGRRGRLRRKLGHPLMPAIAILVTLAIFVWPLAAAPDLPLLETAVVGAGVLALVGLYLRSRVLAARRVGETVRHYTWPPAIAFGGVLSAVGLSFAPLPAAVTPRHRLIRWIGPLALGLFAVALLAAGWWSGAPSTRSLGSAALVLVSSAMLPAKPFDGAYLTHRLVSALVSVALLVLSGLVLLGWL
jgi:tetratricopeptide (TPR) repeat protein